MSSTERIILTALCYVLLGLIVDGRSSNDLTCRVINSKRYFLDADELRRCSNDTCPVCPENESECRRPYHEQCQICCQQGYQLHEKQTGNEEINITDELMKVIEASKLEGDESAKAVTRSRSTDELRKEIKSLHTSYSIALVVVVVGAGIIIHKQAKAIAKMGGNKTYL